MTKQPCSHSASVQEIVLERSRNISYDVDTKAIYADERSLAYTELRLVFARMLWNFDFELMDDSRDWTNQKVRFFANPNSCKCGMSALWL